jgi:uncharacterized membrane protein YdjX (TVP38/TMEM64 family)
MAILIASYFFIPSFQHFIKDVYKLLTSDDEERIAALVSKFGIAGPLMLVLFMVVQMFLFVVPMKL